MGLPALENGPYIFNVNNLITGSSLADKSFKCWLALKNELVALGGAGVIWTVVASSDASTVKNIGDADPDLWLDTGDLNHGTGNHSWCILENSTTGAQISIQLNYDVEHQGRVRYSPGGTYSTDGTISALPTATDANYIGGGSCFATDSGANKAVLNIMTSADKKCTRIYFHERNPTTGATGGKVMFAEEAVNTPALWISAHKSVAVYNTSPVILNTTPHDCTPRIDDLDSNWVARVDTATESVSVWANPTCECYNGLSDTSAEATPIIHCSANLEFNEGWPIAPIGLYETDAGQWGGSWGRIRDLYWAYYLHNTLDTYPSDGSRQWIKWGCFLVPWNGDVPLDAV